MLGRGHLSSITLPGTETLITHNHSNSMHNEGLCGMLGLDSRPGQWAHVCSVQRDGKERERLEDNGNDSVCICMFRLDINIKPVCVCVFG